MLKNRIASCVTVGIFVAVSGYFLSLTMFSGEDEMGNLMAQWQLYPAGILILTGIIKLLLVNICYNTCGYKRFCSVKNTCAKSLYKIK